MPPTNPANAEFIESFTPILILSYLGMLGFILLFLRNIRIILREPEIPAMKNATGENIPLPEHYAETDAHLRRLNLISLGIKHCLTSYNKSGDYMWLYVTPDQQIQAEVSYTGASPQPVGFATAFADDAMLITAYTKGKNVTTRNFSSNFEQNSLEAALEYHRQKVAVWAKIHGEPRIIKEIEDTYYLTELYLKRYVRLFYRQALLRNIVAIILVMTIMLMGIVASLIPPCNC